MNHDLRLQQRVIDALEFEPGIDAASIGVSARDSVVTLTGHVRGYAEKFAAERAVRRVKGVEAVAQELEVRLPSDKKLADDEIAARAARLLEWDAAIPAGRISIKVEHGVVTLSGVVDWHYQRVEAEYDVRKLGGVRAVVNDVTVTPKPRAADVRAKIHAAIGRHAGLDADTITIDVSGGRVTLAGTVSAWTGREAAERAAWSAPGVIEVENHITLERP
ncbi:MAG TPA: BON domain-containing protein [Stellaceae bacterium]|nr:BON domain-containing protein [Stellaceae bacterium]